MRAAAGECDYQGYFQYRAKDGLLVAKDPIG